MGPARPDTITPLFMQLSLKSFTWTGLTNTFNLKLFYMNIFTFEGFGLPPLVELTVLSIESALLRFNVCFDILDDKFEEFFLSFLCVPIKINMID